MPRPPLRNPWSDEAPAAPSTLATDSIWPYRLLHVPTMTSHKRKGEDIYDGVRKPRYNVLSYTWGRWRGKDGQFPSIEIHGVPWTIPCIDPKPAFDKTQFKAAIEQAARGVQEPGCDWLWVDIACIPQEGPLKDNENNHARKRDVDVEDVEDLRVVAAQEVGRQVAIFARAGESFAWLWGLKRSTLRVGGWQPRVGDLEGHLIPLGAKNIDRSPPHQSLPPEEDLQSFFHESECLFGLDQASRLFEMWIKRIMEHPWCNFLWTLQEMVLRPDAWILCDDGLVELDSGRDKPFPPMFSTDVMRNLPKTMAITINRGGKWSLSDIKFEIFLLGSLLENNNYIISHLWEGSKKIETSLKTQIDDEDLENQMPSVAGIQQRLRDTLDLVRERGMDAMHISFPHTAYSAAQRRQVSRPLDSIFGIVQTYGITCEAFPEGADDGERLAALQDDFGEKLVFKMPVVSQLFIHDLGTESGEVQYPRRSWLITTKCKVNDHWWESFESGYNIINLFDCFRPIHEAENLLLKFEGRAWDIDGFVQNPTQSNTWARTKLFTPVAAGKSVSDYNGLMLDIHVSMTVLGRRVDYFSSFEEMTGAVDALKHYHGKGSGPTDTHKLRVASLGCSFRDDLPHVYHVGLVLAPSATPKPAAKCGTEEQEIWSRIGLMRWVEEYPRGCVLEKHPGLPQPDEFSCIID